ncbi:MAG: VWA domain-containing protein [Cardiobacteriaceae bacterium]|nr:VWA domain-containing protein [Cardiobacteriaceae bacterium]
MATRRLLTYIALDTSGSMNGEPIVSLNVGMHSLLAAVRSDPYTLENVWLSIWTFNTTVKNILPLVEAEQAYFDDCVCPQSGATFTGLCLEQIVLDVKKNIRPNTLGQKGDWAPLLVLFTDGRPSDTAAFRRAVAEIKQLKFSKIVACAAGPKADVNFLQQLTPDVVSLDTADSSSFAQFFQFLSSTISAQSHSVGANVGNGSSSVLPPPPAVINP